MRIPSRAGVPLILLPLVLGLGACAAMKVALAPGAAEVRLVRNPDELPGCRAVGNVRVPRDAHDLVDLANAEPQFRNQVIGLGGNAGLVTEGALGVPTAGLAYRCP